MFDFDPDSEQFVRALARVRTRRRPVCWIIQRSAMATTRVGKASLALLACSTLVGGLLGDRVLAGGGRLSEHLRVYTALLSAVEDEYMDEVPSEKLVAASIREMLRTLDPHSNFLEIKEYNTLQERQRGSYYGLGITVQAVDGNITVVAPFEGTPAFRLGIRAGDVISKIEDEDARGMSIDDAVKRLRGPKGSSVQHHPDARGLRRSRSSSP